MSPDVLIIGAGVAGISAVHWLVDQGFSPLDRAQGEAPTFLWVEASHRIGGVLHQVHNPLAQLVSTRNSSPVHWLEVAEARLAHARLTPRFGTRVHRLSPAEDNVTVYLADDIITAGLAIVATGTTRRTLGLPGEVAHVGRGVARSGRAERHRFQSKRVVIIGGGDAALENAMLLSEVGAEVVLIHRSAEFSARADFQHAVDTDPRIEVRRCTEVTAIEAEDGAPWLDSVVLRDGSRIPTDGLLIRIGVEGCYPVIEGLTEPGSFLPQRPHPRIIAAGDCTCPDFRAVPVAEGQGAEAARMATVILGLRPS